MMEFMECSMVFMRLFHWMSLPGSHETHGIEFSDGVCGSKFSPTSIGGESPIRMG
jgi:hypothetical protein